VLAMPSAVIERPWNDLADALRAGKTERAAGKLRGGRMGTGRPDRGLELLASDVSLTV